jgi:hypothetical protein
MPFSSAHAATRPVPLTLSVPPTIEAPAQVQIEVQTLPRTTVTLRLHDPAGTTTQVTPSGGKGRAHFTYGTTSDTVSYTLTATVAVRVNGHTHSAKRTSQVHAFSPHLAVSQIQVLRDSGGVFTPVATVNVGDRLRLTAAFAVLEPAGWFIPPCIQGTIHLRRSGVELLTLPLQCPASPPPNSSPSVYADLTVSAAIGGGSVDAEFDLTYDMGKYGVAHGSGTASFTIAG